MEPVKDGGLWKCPICGFSAMNRKTVEVHMKKAHPEAGEGKKAGKKAKKERREVDYLRELEGEHVRIHFSTGLELECRVLDAKDRFRVKVETEDGRTLIIERGTVLFYEIL